MWIINSKEPQGQKNRKHQGKCIQLTIHDKLPTIRSTKEVGSIYTLLGSVRVQLDSSPILKGLANWNPRHMENSGYETLFFGWAPSLLRLLDRGETDALLVFYLPAPLLTPAGGSQAIKKEKRKNRNNTNITSKIHSNQINVWTTTLSDIELSP